MFRIERTLSPSVISFFLEFGSVCVCVRRGGRVKSRRMYDDDAPDDLMIVSNTDGHGAHTYNQKKKKEEGNGREDMVVKLLSNSIDSSSFFSPPCPTGRDEGVVLSAAGLSAAGVKDTIANES